MKSEYTNAIQQNGSAVGSCYWPQNTITSSSLTATLIITFVMVWTFHFLQTVHHHHHQGYNIPHISLKISQMSPVLQSIPLHIGLTPWRYQSKTRDAVWERPSTGFNNHHFCKHKDPTVYVVWSFIQFLTSTSGSGHFAICVWKESLLSSNFSNSPLSFSIHYQFLGGSGPKCLLSVSVPHSCSNSITFNLKPMVYNILICLLYIPLGE